MSATADLSPASLLARPGEYVTVGWDEANAPHELALRLVDGDGNVVRLCRPT